MRRARERDPGFPPPVFVYPSDSASGDSFFDARWPSVSAIADPERELYRAFGLHRGAVRELLGPQVFLAGLRALRSGHGVGFPKGDTLILSGAFLITRARVEWAHYAAHTGDIVEPQRVPRLEPPAQP